MLHTLAGMPVPTDHRTIYAESVTSNVRLPRIVDEAQQILTALR